MTKRLTVILFAIVCLTAAPGCVSPEQAAEAQIASNDAAARYESAQRTRDDAKAKIDASKIAVEVMAQEFATATPERKAELLGLITAEIGSNGPWAAQYAQATKDMAEAHTEKVKADLIVQQASAQEAVLGAGLGALDIVLPGAGIAVGAVVMGIRSRKKQGGLIESIAAGGGPADPEATEAYMLANAPHLVGEIAVYKAKKGVKNNKAAVQITA